MEPGLPPDRQPSQPGSGQPDWPDVSKTSRGYRRRTTAGVLTVILLAAAVVSVGAIGYQSAPRGAGGDAAQPDRSDHGTLPTMVPSGEAPESTRRAAPTSTVTRPTSGPVLPVSFRLSAELPAGYVAQTVTVSLRGIQVAALRMTAAEPVAHQLITAVPGRYTYQLIGQATPRGSARSVPMTGVGTVSITGPRPLVVEAHLQNDRLQASLRVTDG